MRDGVVQCAFFGFGGQNEIDTVRRQGFWDRWRSDLRGRDTVMGPARISAVFAPFFNHLRDRIFPVTIGPHLKHTLRGHRRRLWQKWWLRKKSRLLFDELILDLRESLGDGLAGRAVSVLACDAFPQVNDGVQLAYISAPRPDECVILFLQQCPWGILTRPGVWSWCGSPVRSGPPIARAISRQGKP